VARNCSIENRISRNSRKNPHTSLHYKGRLQSGFQNSSTTLMDSRNRRRQTPARGRSKRLSNPAKEQSRLGSLSACK
jgi:hypothetical protein